MKISANSAKSFYRWMAKALIKLIRRTVCAWNCFVNHYNWRLWNDKGRDKSQLCGAGNDPRATIAKKNFDIKFSQPLNRKHRDSFEILISRSARRGLSNKNVLGAIIPNRLLQLRELIPIELYFPRKFELLSLAENWQLCLICMNYNELTGLPCRTR